MFILSIAFNTMFLEYFKTDAVKTKHKYHGRWDHSPKKAFPAVKLHSNQKKASVLIQGMDMFSCM